MELEQCIIDGGPVCRSGNCGCIRRLSPGIKIRVVGTDLVFPNVGACARHFRVSNPTIMKILEAKEPYGDVQLEYLDE